MPAGRPTKLTPETTAALVKVLSAGNTRRAACDYAGIANETFLAWLRAVGTAEDDDGRYSAFSESITRAEARAEVGHVATLAKASQEGDWRAAESWLKRRRRDDWGDHLTVSKMPDDELAAAVFGIAHSLQPAAPVDSARAGTDGRVPTPWPETADARPNGASEPV